MYDSPATVVVVDHDVILYQRLCACLDATVCTIKHINSTAQWSKNIAAQRPDLIIVSLAMHGLELEALFECSRLQLGHIPVLIAAEEIAVARVASLISSGALNVISVALSDSELQTIIAQALHVRAQADEHAENRIAVIKLNRELKDKVAELEPDQNAGRLVQSRFLPQTPVAFNGLKVSYRIFPSHYLSGDSIDYGLIGGRYLAFYLTDVAGHGSASSFVAVWVRQLVRSFLREQANFHSRESFENDIPGLLEQINNELIKADVGHHLTSFVAVLDTNTDELHYAVAGHLPLPIILSASSATPLAGKGKVLGLFEGAKWQINRLKLPDSFSLVVFSDGILEVLPGEDLQKREQFLCTHLQGMQPKDVAELEAALPLANIGVVPDDVAMLVLSRR